ncbi:MAG: hypothetical protein U9P63_01340 [Patescibacteria group bacterium]|nr:hypothetical protein [Patescibacteria group bacterium]
MPNFLEISLTIFNIIYLTGEFLLSLWWIYIPWFFFVLARDLWFKHQRQRFANKTEWILLEVVPPREIQKTAQAMEQFFAGMHAIQGTPNWWERNIMGSFQKYFSMEIVSLGGEIHFLIRVAADFRNMVEAHIYAQYPEAEITQTDDYVNSFHLNIPNEDYDLWGTEFILAKEDAYPIKTYPAFEKEAKAEEQRIDPISSLLETMNKIGDGEQIWIQTLVRPVNDKWKEEGEKLRDKLIGRKKEAEQSLIAKEAGAWRDAAQEVAYKIVADGTFSEGDAKKDEKETPWLWASTKAEQNVINSIEENLSKIGYEVIIRFLYLARKDAFKIANVPTVIGCYKQFNSQNLNGFKPYSKVKTSAIDYKIQLKKVRETYRKKKIFADYKKREFVQQSAVISYMKPLIFERLPILNWFFIRSKPFVFNIEELATIYHYPAITVKAPLTPKVEAKKAEPPKGLPIE